MKDPKYWPRELQIKLERAPILMARDPQLTVKETASRLGFHNAREDFTNLFRSFHGKTPTDLRKELRVEVKETDFVPTAITAYVTTLSWSDMLMGMLPTVTGFDRIDEIIIEDLWLLENGQRLKMSRSNLTHAMFERTLRGGDHNVLIDVNKRGESFNIHYTHNDKRSIAPFMVKCTVGVNLPVKETFKWSGATISSLQRGDKFTEPKRGGGNIYEVTELLNGGVRVVRCLNRFWEGVVDYSNQVIEVREDLERMNIKYFSGRVSKIRSTEVRLVKDHPIRYKQEIELDDVI